MLENQMAHVVSTLDRLATNQVELDNALSTLADAHIKTQLQFRETDAHRLWLGVFPDNARARRTYAVLGFREEGIARGSAFFGGVHRDELVMALLRPDWVAAGR